MYKYSCFNMAAVTQPSLFPYTEESVLTLNSDLCYYAVYKYVKYCRFQLYSGVCLWWVKLLQLILQFLAEMCVFTIWTVWLCPPPQHLNDVFLVQNYKVIQWSSKSPSSSCTLIAAIMTFASRLHRKWWKRSNLLWTYIWNLQNLSRKSANCTHQIDFRMFPVIMSFYTGLLVIYRDMFLMFGSLDILSSIKNTFSVCKNKASMQDVFVMMVLPEGPAEWKR